MVALTRWRIDGMWQLFSRSSLVTQARAQNLISIGWSAGEDRKLADRQTEKERERERERETHLA